MENAALDVSEENATTEGTTQENVPDNAKSVGDASQLSDAIKESFQAVHLNIHENEGRFGLKRPEKEDKSDEQSNKEIEMAFHKVRTYLVKS